MPSFDITSSPDSNEIRNAVEIALREIEHRYDFKDSKTAIETVGSSSAPTALEIDSIDEYKVQAAWDVLREKMAKRKIELGFFAPEKIAVAPSGRAAMTIKILSGIDRELGSKINKAIKAAKVKVQVEIRGDEVRVSGKKRDLLQEAIQLLKEQVQGQPLHFGNFRD